MKRALLLSGLFLAACGAASDPSVTAIASLGWPDSGGMYRVIQRNTEIDPCLTVESVALADTPQVQTSAEICPVNVGIDDSAYIGYDDLRADGNVFRIRMNVEPLAGGPERWYDCVIDDFAVAPVMTCSETPEKPSAS